MAVIKTNSLSGLGYQWAQGGAGGALVLGNGIANITYIANSVSMVDADQVLINVLVTGATNVVMRLIQMTPGLNTCLEVIEAPGAIVAGAQRYTLYPKEWGPLSPSASGYSILRPIAGVAFRYGFYADGAPAPGDTIVTEIVRVGTGALQASGS